MSQVATESSSSSQSSLMSQHVHNIDSSGIGGAESALPLKSINLSSCGDSCPLEAHHPQQPHNRVRRSCRLAKRSTKLKRESADITSQRHSPRLRKPQSSHSNHSLHSSSQLPSTSSSSTSIPDAPSRLPTNELLPSTTPSSSSGDIIAASLPHTSTAPESSTLTQSDLTEQSSTRDDLSDTMSTISTQAQAGSPVQFEHSYALTFSSTAEEIPFLNSQVECFETTPNAPPLSGTLDGGAMPNTPPPTSTSSEATPPTTSMTTTLNAESASSIPVSVIQNSITRGTTRETSSNIHVASRTGLPPHMLASTSTASSSSDTTPTEFTQNGANMHTNVPAAIHGVSTSTSTEHAQNDRLRGMNDEGISHSNLASFANNNPLATLFEVPMPVPLAHYPMGSGVRRTTANNSLAEQTARERQRLEQSTAFIASHAQGRATSRRTSRRRRGRRRETEHTELQQVGNAHEHERERSSTRRHTRDRSPISRQRTLPSSSRTQPTRQHSNDSRHGRPPPLLATEPPIPTPTSIHVPISSTSLASSGSGGISDHRSQYIGYQIVPQGQPSSTVAGSSSATALHRPPLPRLHLSQRHLGMPGSSNVHLHASSFHETPRQGTSSRSLTESVIPLSSPHSEVPQIFSLLGSHTDSPFHPPSISHMPSSSHSHVPFLPTSSPQRSRVLGGPIPFQPIAIIDSPQGVGEPTIIVDSPAYQEVPRSSREIGVDLSRGGGVSSRNSGSADSGGRRQSHVEVIVVDSSDSEHEDDDVIVSGISRVPSFPGPPWRMNRHQISSDEAYARRLQEQFDQEVQDHLVRLSSSNQQAVPAAVPAGPSIPLPRPQPHNHHARTLDSGSLIRNNYEALVSHVERLTHNDAVRMLSITRSDARHRTGHTPRTQGEYRRAMESMGEVLIFSAIMGSPGIAGTSYEDLLELAETLGPARPQGLPQEVINNLPVKEFKGSLDTTTNGELPKCVVCMCDFEEKERLRTLPCVHEFHKDCIDQWLKDHRTCPICRVELHGQR